MISKLRELLDYLNAAIDRERSTKIEELFCRSLEGRPVESPPVVYCGPLPHDARFRPFPHREVIVDPEKMLFNELVYGFETSIANDDRMHSDLPWTVRANFGTVLVASMFGAPVEQIDDNPPWIRHEAGEEIGLEAVTDRDPTDFTKGWCPRVIETMEAYHAILGQWSDLYRQIRIVLPDLQGPLDTLELIRGSQLLLELATESEKVDGALTAVATAQIELARRLGPLVNDGPTGYCHQHAAMLKGNVLLRCDSAIMISAEMYRGQIAPHDERVLHELGGGGIHSCGRIHHLLDEFLRLPSLQSLDLGQPELNDMDLIHRKARARNIPLIRVRTSSQDLQTGRTQERFPTGVTLVVREG